MKIRLGICLGALAGTLLGCGEIEPLSPPARSGSADFSTYVALGTSLGAGYTNGGLVERHQRHSYAYLFAGQAGVAAFTIPSISDSGIPPLLVLRSLVPLVITRAATQGSPTNLSQPTPYHNLSVPGAVLRDVNDAALYGRSPVFNLILRGLGTMLDQGLSLNPTFLSLEFGANEVLGPATSGTDQFPAAIEADPGLFAARYAAILDTIERRTPNAEVALFNVPDVTSIPFFTTFSWVSPCSGGTPLLGESGPLGPGDLVLLTAADSLAIGTGFPVGCASYLTGAPGNGRPLPNGLVLTQAETTTIQATIAAYNQTIAAEAAARGLALVDINTLLRVIAAEGLEFRGSHYTNEFVTGGIFGLDGVHPTDFGYAIMANAMIEAVNARYDSNLALVNLADAATVPRYGRRPWLGPGGWRAGAVETHAAPELFSLEPAIP